MQYSAIRWGRWRLKAPARVVDAGKRSIDIRAGVVFKARYLDLNRSRSDSRSLLETSKPSGEERSLMESSRKPLAKVEGRRRMPLSGLTSAWRGTPSLDDWSSWPITRRSGR
jgi:hypothetical protein